MKYCLNSFPIFTPKTIYDYVYHFFVESAWHDFVEVSKSDFMDCLKACRRGCKKHHVDVHQFMPHCYNLYLELPEL